VLIKDFKSTGTVTPEDSKEITKAGNPFRQLDRVAYAKFYYSNGAGQHGVVANVPYFILLRRSEAP
jgi:hypothetical protein